MAVFTMIGTAIAYGAAYMAAAAGISIATATVIGVVAGAVGMAAIAVGVSRMLQPKAPTVPRAEIQAVLTQSDAPRRVYVGQNIVGGVRAFYDVKDGALHQVIVVAHGEVSEFTRFWVDGQPVELDEHGRVTTGKYVGGGFLGTPINEKYYLATQTRNGVGESGNFNVIRNTFSYWDSSRQLMDQATFRVQMNAPKAEDFSKVFPKSYNTGLQWEIKGQPILDPRRAVTEYSDNASMVVAHYLMHPEGYNLHRSEVNLDSVRALADYSDLQIPLLAGGTEPNLRLWGHWTLDEQPIDVLDRMHGSSGIRAYETQDGRIGLIGGPFGTPACTITAKDIREISTSEAINERTGYNVLRVHYVDAGQKYELVEADPWRDEDRLAIEGEIVEEYKLVMCPSRSQARRLAKQQIHNDNRAKVTVITNLVGLKARFPRHYGQRHTILLDYRPEDGSGRVIQGEYEVMNHSFDPVALECRIELERIDRASGEWTPEEEGSASEATPEGDPNLAPDMQAVLTQRVIQASAGNRIAVLEVDTVAVPGRDDITVQAHYRKVGETAWIDMQPSGYSAQSGPVEDGEEYEAEARFNGIFDEPDAWEPLGPITIQIDSAPPGKPTELIPSNGNGYVHLSWRNPSGGFYDLRIYRSTSASFASAALVGSTGGASGQISEYVDATIASATEYNYWVAAANVSGVEGAPAGPANITTPAPPPPPESE